MKNLVLKDNYNFYNRDLYKKCILKKMNWDSILIIMPAYKKIMINSIN